MDLNERCNTGLVLGLGYEGEVGEALRRHQQSCKYPSVDFDSPSPARMEPSVALCLADKTYRSLKEIIHVNKEMDEARQSSPHSERESEDCETERHSPRVSDEEEEGSGRKKLRLTKEQSALLEDSFKEHRTLNPKQKQALAKKLNLRPRQVEVWFQNRRARTKLKQTEVDCEFLKRCCQSLTDENRRLLKEVQELKALKFAHPFYMQLPAATLTLCPSCERTGSRQAAAGDSPGKKPLGMCPMGPTSHFYNPFTHSSAAC